MLLQRSSRKAQTAPRVSCWHAPVRAQHVRDVLRAGVRGAQCGVRVVQAGDGPIPVLARRSRERLQQRVAVGLRPERKWEGAPWPRTRPRFPQKRALRRRGPWLPCKQVPTAAVRPGAVRACKWVGLTAALLPIGSLAVDQEVFLDSVEAGPRDDVPPRARGVWPPHLPRHASKSFERPSSHRVFVTALLCRSSDHAQATTGRNAEQRVGRERILCVKSGDKFSEGSSTRRPNTRESGLVLGTRLARRWPWTCSGAT